MNKIYAVLSVETDTIVATFNPDLNKMLPLVTVEEHLLDLFKILATDLAKKIKEPLKLVEYSNPIIIEVFNPENVDTD